MKKRRTLIISLLIIAALALGIGYAGQTSRLMINGSGNIEADANNFKLVFVGAKDDVAEHDHATFDDTIGRFDVSHLDTIGDRIEFTFTVKNQSPGQINAYLDQAISFQTEPTLIRDSDSTELNIDDYYDISFSIDKTEIAYEEEAEITVTVECKKSFTDNATLTYNFYIEGHSDPGSVKSATTNP